MSVHLWTMNQAHILGAQQRLTQKMIILKVEDFMEIACQKSAQSLKFLKQNLKTGKIKMN